ncbi:glycosyltransferase family 2 protein [Geomonas oryzae]|uniref:glycosyltransferase family 2 protein n=1 Tax=Geomonas oryzae TaxID=2364273 RepID=UPI0013A5D4CD|nr:glycosyltransferase family 2 protein [Geomonas oryzae]
MMEHTEKVTIVIPCYNDGGYLPETVRSAFEQTCQDFRIVIVDDASTDRATREVLVELEKKSRVEVIRLAENGGTGNARNQGIAATATPYILTLDSGDHFAPSFLEKALAVFENDAGVGVVTCGIQEFGIHHGYWLPEGGGVENFLADNNCCGNALFRRAFWEDAGGYDTTILYEDWDFWISGTSKGWTVHVLQEPLFFYRITGRSKSSHDATQRADIYQKMVRKHRQCFCDNIEHLLYEKEMQLITRYNCPNYQKFLKVLNWLFKVRRLLSFGRAGRA